ncbi:hypothetical protein VaNZ11_005017 [Volvox africanus]|uniref:Protein kinase domain-containing protein n=1 Tax=Volvox africanus TaxID=51714 RepID=A0ABQ5RXQ2_9CHLO|nr:hypothetical protein VaNZ11_005017 [Volvox africanus]
MNRETMKGIDDEDPRRGKAWSFLVKSLSGSTRIGLSVLLVLLPQLVVATFAQSQVEVSVASTVELRAALLSGATMVAVTANLNFNESNWPGPVLITKQVTIYSSYRFKLDFCGSKGAPARPLINVTAPGSLLLQKVFLRNFLPSTPQNLSGLGPVPALLSSGGTITFRLTVFHFLPTVMWAFNPLLTDSFWAREGQNALRSVYTGEGLQLKRPALYLIKFSSLDQPTGRYFMDTCYSPMDLNSCYADDGEDTTLVYCLYTFADSFRNPAVRHIRIFHDIGLDRVAYSISRPIIVSQPKSFSACAGSYPSINMENLAGAVMIRNAIDFTGLHFKGSLSTNYTAWPPDWPLLPSLFDVSGSGVLSIKDSTVEVPDLAGMVKKLRALPGCCSADPTRPSLQPQMKAWPQEVDLEHAAALAALPVPSVNSNSSESGSSTFTATTSSCGIIYDAWRPDDSADLPNVTIQQWVFEQNAWRQYSAGALNTYDVLNSPSAAAWRFDGVVVQQAENANNRALCFGGALEQGTVMRSGVTVVTNEVQLRQALVGGARYVQVVSDIKFTAQVWPSGDSALVNNAGIIEIRGCHPQFSQRFTLDLSDLTAVVRTRGRLIFQGDLRFVNVGWTTVSRDQLLAVASGTSEVSPLGAFTLAANGLGSVECEGVIIDGVYDPTAFRYEDLLAVLHLNHMTAEVRARNASLRGDRGITLGFWNMSQMSPQGYWYFTNTQINWAPMTTLPPAATAAAGATTRGGGGGAPVYIVVPCVVVGVLVLAAVLLGVVLIWRRVQCRRRGRVELTAHALAAAAAALVGNSSGRGGRWPLQEEDSKKKSAVVFSNSMAEALAQAQSSGGDGTDSEAAAALAAVLQAANKIITSNGNSNCSASGTRTELSGMAVAAALAAIGKGLSDRGSAFNGGAAAGAAATSTTAGGGGDQQEREQGLAGLRVNVADSRSKGPWGDINAAKREMMAGRHLPNTSGTTSALDDLELQAVLGEGSYGRVYRALWRGTMVAAKVILLPAHMTGRERHERMAVMEAAISSSLSHPNIVQTYTYGVERVDGAKARRMRLAGSQCNSALPEASTGIVSAGGGRGGAGRRGGGGGLDGGGGGGGGGTGGRRGTAAGSMAPREGSGGGGGDGKDQDDDVMGWEICLVQEYCDLGSLRDKLNACAFFRTTLAAAVAPPLSVIAAVTPTSPTSVILEETERESKEKRGSGREPSTEVMQVAATAAAAAAAATSSSSCIGQCDSLGSSSLPQPPPPPMLVDLAAVLDTAIDVARAVAHLHREGIVHADLKPRNVLLKGSTTDPRGFVAKVADFGLSMRLDPSETHVSNAFHGTLAYMAPETLLHGHVSRASDVYGFGILLYELYTADVAFRGVPKALIGHAITKENLRPVFPATLGAPFEYQLLACRCWESNPEIRPEFDFILDSLKRMRVRLCATAPDGSSFGPMGRLATGLSLGSHGAPTGARLWGLPVLPQVLSQQGGPFHTGPHGNPGAHPLLRAVAGGFTDERTLSSSYSITMSSIGGFTGLHNTTAATPAAVAAAATAVANAAATAAAAAIVGFGPAKGCTTSPLGSRTGEGSYVASRTVTSPACLDVRAEVGEVEEGEEAAAAVHSL